MTSLEAELSSDKDAPASDLSSEVDEEFWTSLSFSRSLETLSSFESFEIGESPPELRLRFPPELCLLFEAELLSDSDDDSGESWLFI